MVDFALFDLLLPFSFEDGHSLLECKDFFKPKLIFLAKPSQKTIFFLQLLPALFEFFL